MQSSRVDDLSLLSPFECQDRSMVVGRIMLDCHLIYITAESCNPDLDLVNNPYKVNVSGTARQLGSLQWARHVTHVLL